MGSPLHWDRSTCQCWVDWRLSGSSHSPVCGQSLPLCHCCWTSQICSLRQVQHLCHVPRKQKSGKKGAVGCKHIIMMTLQFGHLSVPYLVIWMHGLWFLSTTTKTLSHTIRNYWYLFRNCLWDPCDCKNTYIPDCSRYWPVSCFKSYLVSAVEPASSHALHNTTSLQ